MKIKNIQIILRSRSLDEIFDLAFLLLRHNLIQYFKLLIIPFLFFACINISIPFLFEYEEGITEFNWAAQFLMLMILFSQKTLISMFLVIHNGHFLFNNKPSKRTIWKEVIKFSPRYIWNQIVLRGTYILFFPWTFILPWRSFVTHFFKSEVLLLEQLKGSNAKQRLSAMSRGHIDRILLFIFMDLVFFIVYFFVFFLTFNQLLTLFNLDSMYWWLDADMKLLFLSPPITILLIPYFVFHSIAKFLFYIDSRSQKEGWDIELQLLQGIENTEGINDKS